MAVASSFIRQIPVVESRLATGLRASWFGQVTVPAHSRGCSANLYGITVTGSIVEKDKMDSTCRPGYADAQVRHMLDVSKEAAALSDEKSQR